MPVAKDTDLASELTFELLSKKNWNKFVQLFGERGACGNCWCMYFRLSKGDFADGKENDGNKKAMKSLVLPVSQPAYWDCTRVSR